MKIAAIARVPRTARCRSEVMMDVRKEEMRGLVLTEPLETEY